MTYHRACRSWNNILFCFWSFSFPSISSLLPFSCHYLKLVPEGFECATASLSVIAVLVQASRKRPGVDAIVEAMQFLGACGIRPDAETMEVNVLSYINVEVNPK